MLRQDTKVVISWAFSTESVSESVSVCVFGGSVWGVGTEGETTSLIRWNGLEKGTKERMKGRKKVREISKVQIMNK